MVKLMAFLPRKRGISPEVFQEHWRTKHAEIVVRLPGLRRYVQCHTLLSGYARRSPRWDGVAEAWFDDTDAMRALADAPAYRNVRADEPGFLDVEAMSSVITEEHLILDGPVPAEGVVNLAFLNKRPDLEIEAFHSYWRAVHGPIAASIPGLRRYVQSHTSGGIYRAGRTPAYDGVAKTWFDDTDAMRAAATTVEYARTRADEVQFLATPPPPFVLAREVVILP